MRRALATLLLLTLPCSALAAKAKAGAKATPAATGKTASPAGVSDASVAACVTEFVESLNSLDDERVLSALTPGDRVSLRGRQNMIGLIFGRKILNPQVKSFDKLEKDGKVVGAKAVVSVDEVDPLDGMKSAKDHTWFLAVDEKGTLKVSLASVWLDLGKIGQLE